MRNWTYYYIISLIIFTNLGSNAQTDSLSVTPTELKETIVVAKNIKIEHNKIEFIPNSKSKNLSSNLPSLIERMNTGILMVRNGKIISATGEDVNIFINGNPADNLDLETFWPKNVQKIQYIINTENPEFFGKSNILNIITKEYIAGGLTRISGEQNIPNDGNYSLSSKLSWGRMTYNAAISYNYLRNNYNAENFHEQYNSSFYEGNFYPEILYNGESLNKNKSHGMYGGLNARYKYGKFRMTNNVSLQWDKVPCNFTFTKGYYSNGIIKPISSQSTLAEKKISPSYKGFFQYFFNNNYTVICDLNYNHSHNTSNYTYNNSNIFIHNITEENANNYIFRGHSIYSFSQKNRIRVSILENLQTYSIDYKGNSISQQKQNINNFNIEMEWYWHPINRFSIQLVPSINNSHVVVNKKTQFDRWTPGLNCNLSFNATQNCFLNLNTWYARKEQNASLRNDLTLQISELKWLEGNPSLKSSDFYWHSLDIFAIISKWLHSTLSFSYKSDNNQSRILYRPGDETQSGVIGQYVNGIKNKIFMIDWSFTLSLFKGNLIISNQTGYQYQNYGFNAMQHAFRIRPVIRWDFHNCSLSAYYASPEKYFIMNGSERIIGPHYYSLRFNYGNGNILLDIELSNPFTKYLYTTNQLINSGAYSYLRDQRDKGRCISATLTYTFDYGKKVDHNIEIDTHSNHSTSRLGSSD